METPSEKDDKLCPSYLAKPGAELFGYVSDGKVQYLDETIVVDKTFVKEAQKGRSPESRFRFAGKCIQGGCAQWDNQNGVCGLTDRILAITEQIEHHTLQHCAIREKCRWFSQRGAKACAVCSDSVRNMEEAFITS
ncbi:MAG: hypothetical protein QM534_19160 [Sediminibacterium sp.]|nr:hypothetical protein [Sediminibacterium sp.]